MIIAATSDFDITSEEALIEELEKIDEPDLLLLAGDMYDFRRPSVYKEIVKFLDRKKWKCPAVAVPGNHESEEEYEKIIEYCGDRIKFLDDESVTYTIKGEKIGIVGSRGCLDQATEWQIGNIIGVSDTYKFRIAKLKDMLSKLKCDIKIFLTHYAPTYVTLRGESSSLYPVLGSRKMEPVIVKTKIDFAVHGHAHYGARLGFVNKIPIFNVAYLVNQKVVLIDTDKLPKPKV